jgi:protein-S-isoprenylcysteine O-methyltransferase Ste14
LATYNQLNCFPFNLCGIALIFIGLGLAGRSKDIFKANETPHNFDEPNKLVTTGIYSKSRNPMYGGMLLFIVGFAICFQNVVGLMIPLLFFLVINYLFIPFEENRMKKYFGTEYLEYKKRVGRWF